MTRGEVVLVDWPYSDQTGKKLRPAIVVQNDLLNGLIDDTVLVQITTTKHGIPDTEVEIDPGQETASGLLHVSYASCDNILTYDQGLVQQTLGFLSPATMRQVAECLKKVLELP
jgi:mRNA interferase MazF